MSSYRRASLQERLEWGRRRSSSSIPPVVNQRRCSVAVPSVRFRANSKANSDAFALEVIHPDLEDLKRMIPGLDDDVTFEPTVISLPVEEAADRTESIPKADTPPPPPPLRDDYIPPSQEEIHHILSKITARTSCFSSCGESTNITISKVEYCPRYRYILQSFTEKRQLSWNFEPYTGDKLDEPSNGAMPDPWTILCPGPTMFQNSTVTADVPHTDCLFTCCTCGGLGRKRCPVCNASGWKRCSFCLGDGHKIALHGHKERCHSCLGIGTKKCWRCSNGMATCQGCGGTGQVKYFLTLTVTWNNHSDTQINGNSDDLWGRLQSAVGNTVYEEQLAEALPVEHFSDKSVCEMSAHLLDKHKRLLSSEKILAQWQKFEVIPVTEVTYYVEGISRQCAIYGIENSVYVPQQEQKCCTLI